MTKRSPDPLDPLAKAAGTARLSSMQAPFDRVLYHPLAARLAAMLARTPITPNMVSVVGGLVVVLAGIAYIQSGWLGPVFLGLALHMLWHVLDGADGDLARLTGRTSPRGEIVDGVCDYAGHILLYILLASAAFASAGWIVIFFCIAAGLSRIMQASFHESQKRQYLNWVHDVRWLRSYRDKRKSGLLSIGNAYLTLVSWLSPPNADVDRAIADPERRERVRATLANIGPLRFAGSTLLGATYRTLALGLSMLAGSPLWYFVYEAVILNIVLVHGVWRSRTALESVRAGL